MAELIRVISVYLWLVFCGELLTLMSMFAFLKERLCSLQREL